MPSTIQIVDDAQFMRIMLKDIVEKNGYNVIVQTDTGKGAIEKFFVSKPDLLLLDLTLPDIGGLEVLRLIIAQNPNARVVMVGISGQEKILEQCIAEGAKGYVIKPFSQDKVIKTIKLAFQE